MFVINETTRVGEIVRFNFKSASVFEMYKIDYCCDGNVTIKNAIINKNLDLDILIKEINKSIEAYDQYSLNIEQLKPDELCDHIISTHHKYINDNIPLIQSRLQKICEVHGDKHHELFLVRGLFEDCARDIKTHLDREEVFLFAYIKKMCEFQKSNNLNSGEFGDVIITLNTLLSDHKIEGRRFVEISNLTNNYQAPLDACPTYKATFGSLKEFEQDLHKHIHVENNILFHKALKLERELI